MTARAARRLSRSEPHVAAAGTPVLPLVYVVISPTPPPGFVGLLAGPIPRFPLVLFRARRAENVRPSHGSGDRAEPVGFVTLVVDADVRIPSRCACSVNGSSFEVVFYYHFTKFSLVPGHTTVRPSDKDETPLRNEYENPIARRHPRLRAGGNSGRRHTCQDLTTVAAVT